MRYLLLVNVILLVACVPGPPGQPTVGIQGNPGVNATPCSISKVSNVATITCPFGQYTIQDGTDGPSGPKGDSGSSCTVSKINIITTISCSDGTSATVLDGVPGQTVVGPQGVDGRDGMNAVPCTTSKVGNTATISCPDGSNTTITDGIAGVMGPVGPQGSKGDSGANGTNGASGDSISTVQFCPGDTIYPSNFPEYGICTQGNIFAVYWDGHNSWLALIAPGYYLSTSSTNPCNFTVQANCIITN